MAKKELLEPEDVDDRCFIRKGHWKFKIPGFEIGKMDEMEVRGDGGRFSIIRHGTRYVVLLTFNLDGEETVVVREKVKSKRMWERPDGRPQKEPKGIHRAVYRSINDNE